MFLSLLFICIDFFVTPSHQDSGTQIYTKNFLHCLTQRVNVLWAKGGFLLMAKEDNSHWPTWSNSLGFSSDIGSTSYSFQTRYAGRHNAYYQSGFYD